MRTIFLFIFLQIPIVNFLWCQKVMDKGVIEYTITDIESINPDQSNDFQSSMLLGSTVTLYFHNNDFRRDMNFMNGMMQYTQISNTKEGSHTLYINMQGHKMSVELERDIFDRTEPEVIRSNVLYNKSDTQNILNYSCYLAEIDSTNNVLEAKYTMYITEGLVIPDYSIFEINTTGLSGIPLKISKTDANFTTIFTTTHLSSDINSDVFDFDDTGYQHFTHQEFEDKFGKLPGLD